MTAKNLPAGSSFANKSPGTSPDELIAQYTFCGAYSTACYHQTFSGSYFPVTLVFPNGACSNNGRGRWPGLGSVWEVVRGTNWVFLLTMHWIRDAHVVKTSQQAELLTPSRTREDAYVAPCDGCGEGPQPEAWTVDPQHAVTCHHRVRLGVCGVGYDEVVVQMEEYAHSNLLNANLQFLEMGRKVPILGNEILIGSKSNIYLFFSGIVYVQKVASQYGRQVQEGQRVNTPFILTRFLA
ncbi:hypothetical protein ARMSODRAFT_971978 [Armillaria solidipes]|uniref:Uncharacterized protein n=1 Tax=Armillaria solidipes TaxID=1076256 RepID=A0A2H3BRP1_9AGAR|nr:hypothetical protein ARMSODRAFT_971978 [Armillaria solidipes]